MDFARHQLLAADGGAVTLDAAPSRRARASPTRSDRRHRTSTPARSPPRSHRSRLPHANRPFLYRSPDLRGRAVDRHRDSRRRRLLVAAGGAISRRRAADDRRPRILSGRVAGGHRRHGRHADRAGSQRRRRHALHVVAEHDRRRDDADDHVPPRHRSRQGPSAGAEPRRHRRAAAAGRSPPAGRHDAQVVARPADGRPPDFAGQAIRSALHRQLRADSGPRRAGPRRRRGRRHAVRPPRVQHARSGSTPSDWPTCRSRPATCSPRSASKTSRWRPASSASRPFPPGQEFQLTVNTLGRLLEPDQFEQSHRQNGRRRPHRPR